MRWAQVEGGGRLPAIPNSEWFGMEGGAYAPSGGMRQTGYQGRGWNPQNWLSEIAQYVQPIDQFLGTAAKAAPSIASAIGQIASYF